MSPFSLLSRPSCSSAGPSGSSALRPGEITMYRPRSDVARGLGREGHSMESLGDARLGGIERLGGGHGIARDLFLRFGHRDVRDTGRREDEQHEKCYHHGVARVPARGAPVPRETRGFAPAGPHDVLLLHGYGNTVEEYGFR